MRTSTRRAVTVSAGTLVLCLSGAGAALAETVPAPSLDTTVATLDCPLPPSPDQLTTCASDTVTGTVATVEKAAGLGSGSGGGTAKPVRRPASTPTLNHHATSAPPAAAQGPAAIRPVAVTMSLPATTGTVAASARMPAVAAPTTTVRMQAAVTSTSPIDKGAPANVLRLVLIALAAASAGALVASHIGVARLSMGRVIAAG